MTRRVISCAVSAHEEFPQLATRRGDLLGGEVLERGGDQGGHGVELVDDRDDETVGLVGLRQVPERVVRDAAMEAN